MNYRLKIGNLKSSTQWLFILICSCLVWLFTSSFYTLPANAVQGDGTFFTTDELVVNRFSCGNTFVTYDIKDLINNSSIPEIQKEIFNNSLENELGFVIVAQDNLAPDYRIVRIQYENLSTPSAIPVISYTSSSDQYFISNHSTNNLIYIDMNSECELTVNYYNFNAALQLSEQNSSSEAATALFAYSGNYTIDGSVNEENLPEDGLPSTIPNPPSTLVPNIFMHSVVDFKGEFSDRNYLTTDGVLPVLCEPGALAPVITLTLFQGASAIGEPIDTIQASASSVFWIDFKAYDPSYGEFTIVSAYTCGEESTPTFSEHSEYTFEVDENGFLINQGFEACITDTFPYVDFDACWNNITLLANRLSFDTISFAPDWRINDNGCRTLGTIGDWINAEGANRVVCPQFSSEVRNIVTPFVTFILGIVTLGILITKTRREQF